MPRVSRGTGKAFARRVPGYATGVFAFGRMCLRPGDARSFCGAKSRSLMAAGMAGQGKSRALFLHAAFDGAFSVGGGRLAPSGGFCRAFRGERERRSRGGPRRGGTGAFAFGGMRLRPGDARFFCGAKSRSLMAAGMAGQGKTARSFCTRLLMGLSASDAVGWLSPGPFFAARFAEDGRRLRGGSRWGGTGAFAFGRMRLRPGDARFFCGAKSRSLMAAGMAGQGKAARSFRTRLLMGLSASDAVGWLPRGLFAARFAGDGRRSRGGPRWGGTGAGPLLGTGRVDVALGQDERWPLKGKRTCRAGAVWRRLRGVGRCRGVAQGYATRGVHGHEGTCRASGRDAARLIADSGRHVPRRIRRDAHSAGGACRVNTGGRGMPRGAMSAGAFRVWAGRQSLCRNVLRPGGTAILVREAFCA